MSETMADGTEVKAPRVMNLYQAQRHAEDSGEFDKGRFLAMFPSGPRVCRWRDAYMGIFQIEGINDIDNTFVMVHQIDDAFPDLQVLSLPSDQDERK